MQLYKNLEIVKGMDSSFTFNLKDETFLDLDTTGYTFRLEIYDFDGTFKVIITDPIFGATGEVHFLMSAGQTSVFSNPQYGYRLIGFSPQGIYEVLATGMLTIALPPFSDTSLNNVTALPNGTLYITAPTDLQKNVWYATTDMYRLVVTGIGVMTVDGKNLAGNVFGNLDTYQSIVMDENVWRPNLVGMNAFRLKQVAGNNLVRFLP